LGESRLFCLFSPSFLIYNRLPLSGLGAWDGLYLSFGANSAQRNESESAIDRAVQPRARPPQLGITSSAGFCLRRASNSNCRFSLFSGAEVGGLDVVGAADGLQFGVVEQGMQAAGPLPQFHLEGRALVAGLDGLFEAFPLDHYADPANRQVGPFGQHAVGDFGLWAALALPEGRRRPPCRGSRVAVGADLQARGAAAGVAAAGDPPIGVEKAEGLLLEAQVAENRLFQRTKGHEG